MKIKINDSLIDFDKNKIKFSLDFEDDLNNLLKQNHAYGYRGVEDGIMYKLVELICEKMMEEKADELVNRIDLDAIIKRVQIKMVSNLANG